MHYHLINELSISRVSSMRTACLFSTCIGSKCPIEQETNNHYDSSLPSRKIKCHKTAMSKTMPWFDAPFSATYMMSPQRHSNTLVEGEVTVPKDLVNFTFCLRVKPRLNRGETTCEPIAVSYKGKSTLSAVRVIF